MGSRVLDSSVSNRGGCCLLMMMSGERMYFDCEGVVKTLNKSCVFVIWPERKKEANHVSAMY